MREIKLKSIRLSTVAPVCAMSTGGVYTETHMKSNGLTASYLPDAGMVVFRREGHADHFVPIHKVDVAVPVGGGGRSVEPWRLAPLSWDKKGSEENQQPLQRWMDQVDNAIAKNEEAASGDELEAERMAEKPEKGTAFTEKFTKKDVKKAAAAKKKPFGPSSKPRGRVK